MSDKKIIEGLDNGGNGGGQEKFGAFSVRVAAWLDESAGEYTVGWSILPDGVYFRKALDKITLGALQRGGVPLGECPDLVAAIGRANELANDPAVQRRLIAERVTKDLADEKRAKKVPAKYRKAVSTPVTDQNNAPAGRKAGIAGLD
jgi:hypothetical protein